MLLPLKHIIFSVLFLGTLLCSYGQTCKIGDVVINRNDLSKGVVFWLNPEKTGGWMVALKEISFSKFASIPNNLVEKVEPYYFLRDTAGYMNTAKLRNICETGDYGVFQVDFEHGWYIPALGQVLQLVTLGNVLNPIFAAHGGDFMEDELVSSTHSSHNIFYYLWDFSLQEIVSYHVDQTSSTRAVRTFSMSDILIDTTLAYQWNTGATSSYISENPLATTTYTVKATTPEGCSVEASAQVFVNNNSPIEIYDTIRHGEVYTKNGFYESTSGTYYRKIEGELCSSDMWLYLHVLEPLPPTVFNEIICQGQIYSQHNFTAWETGTYNQSWTSVDGRDSTVILNLTVNPVYNQNIGASICPGERYTANGFNETEAGTYIHTFTSRQGCDSVVILQLNILPEYFFAEEKTICQGESYDFRGKTLSIAGIYYDSLTTKTGCDSIYRLTLNVTNKITSNIEASICPGERFTANGFDETEAGTYIHTFPSRQGCDSVVTLQLNILPEYFLTEEKTICQGESYDFRGKTLSVTGVYHDSLKTVTGCDSIYKLILNVTDKITNNIEASICPGERFNANGFDETEAGTYVNHFVTQQGCDSIITLELDILPDYFFDDEQTIPYKESYNFRGQILTVAGIYYDSLKTIAGCDSIYQLKLNISDPIDKDFIIPNTFSPNGDGINDVFMPGHRVKIVNRNGAVIYSGENGWDGYYNGRQASEGVYFYILYLKTDENIKQVTGYITLVR